LSKVLLIALSFNFLIMGVLLIPVVALGGYWRLVVFFASVAVLMVGIEAIQDTHNLKWIRAIGWLLICEFLAVSVCLTISLVQS
jgi:hypothetical protein